MYKNVLLDFFYLLIMSRNNDLSATNLLCCNKQVLFEILKKNEKTTKLSLDLLCTHLIKFYCTSFSKYGSVGNTIICKSTCATKSKIDHKDAVRHPKKRLQ